MAGRVGAAAIAGPRSPAGTPVGLVTAADAADTARRRRRRGGDARATARPSLTPSLTDCAHTIGVDLAALVPPTWQVLLNLMLFAPLMFFATLASRRPRLVAVFALVAPLAAEIVQGWTRRRICSAGDFVVNALGGLAGVALAVAWLVWANQRLNPSLNSLRFLRLINVRMRDMARQPVPNQLARFCLVSYVVSQSASH